MTKEQIIEILAKVGANVYIPYDVKCNIADAILAIPIEMPTDEEIYKLMTTGINWNKTFVNGAIYGAELMKGEIIKRNK